MTLLSVLGKDLLGRMRAWRTTLVIGLHLSLLAAIALGQIHIQQQQQATGFFGSVPGPQQGLFLFNTLASFELVLIIFMTPALTATAISGERERRTFELLLLTRLTSLGIVLGKLLGTLCFLLVVVLGSLPVFSLVFLFGGVAPATLGRVFVVYGAVATVLATAGVCASTLARRPQTSTAVSYALALILVFGSSLASALLATPPQLPFGVQTAPTMAQQLAAAASPITALSSVLPNPSNFNGVPGIVAPVAPSPRNQPLWRLHVAMDATVSVVLLLVAAVAVRRPRWPRRLRRRVAG